MSATRVSVLVVLLGAMACGDPPSKLNSADNSQNGSPNGAANSAMLQYCAANAGEYECTRDTDGFSISMVIEDGCGDLATFADECGVTAELIDGCREKIVECPQDGTAEQHFAEVCGDWFICVVLADQNSSSERDAG